MLWLAIEDEDTHEISEFEKATEEDVLYLMNGYKVNKNNVTKFRLQDDGCIYVGKVYKGGFGYNIWVARKYVEV